MIPHNLLSSLKTLSVIGTVLFVANVQAANWFVRPSSTGSNSGADWNNAWNPSSINWSSVGPGDTVWLAGGTYTNALIVHGVSGTAGNPINIYRVLSSDAAATSAAGWSPTFDSQVVIKCTASGSFTPGLGVPEGNYITIDGRLNSGTLWNNSRVYGIKVVSDPIGGVVSTIGCGYPIGSGAQTTLTGITWRNIDFQGAYNTQSRPSTYVNYGTDFVPYGNPKTNVLLHDCRWMGFCEDIRENVCNNFIIEYSWISDTANDGRDHEDICLSYRFNGWIMRYNVITRSPNDGLAFDPGGFTGFYFYGNVYYNSGPYWYFLINGGGSPPANQFGYHFYNNVFVSSAANLGGWVGTYQTGGAGTCQAGSDVYNNIFVMTQNKLQTDTNCASDYNAYDATPALITPESHGIVSSTATALSWFVNPTAGDFHLTAAGAAALGNGKALSADGFINKDMDGNIRSGTWYRGAYQYSSGTPPAAPTNLRITAAP